MKLEFTDEVEVVEDYAGDVAGGGVADDSNPSVRTCGGVFERRKVP